jgi:hypothetical protein
VIRETLPRIDRLRGAHAAMVSALAATLLGGCPTEPAAPCRTNSDCVAPLVCRSGACTSVPVGDAGGPGDAGPPHDAPLDTPPLDMGWADAPLLAPIELVPNRDSVVVRVPAVSGAQDYRVVIPSAGVTVSSSPDGTEVVEGAVIFCAGRSQHNEPEGSPPNDVLRLIEVLGITEATTVVVEAIDRECPFTGWLGAEHIDLPVLAETAAALGTDRTFPMRTEAEIRAMYGNLIYNGQGPSAVMGRPADPGSPPRVLARAEVVLFPTGTAAAPMAFWEDFSDASDDFAPAGTYSARFGEHNIFRNSRWSYYTYNFETDLLPNQVAIDRGRLRVYSADIAQDIMGAGMLTPRGEPIALSSDSYAHVTFEVDVNATGRRYAWFSLCGPNTGSPYAADGSLTGGMTMEPFFYQPDGASPYAEDWNCLQVFGFDSSYYDVLGDDRSDSHIRMILNRSREDAPGSGPTTLNISPRQISEDRDAGCSWCGWYGRWNAAHDIVDMPLDDLLRASPRVRWDLYIRRNRVVLYLDGEQYACSDFPGTPLTMNEGALGFGQVLYHTSAEHTDLRRSDWLRTGQRRYLTIAPFIDDRSWDNIGWDTGTGLPADFDEALCFVSQRTFDDWTVN